MVIHANTSDFDIKHLRKVLTTFWNEQFRVEATAHGLVAAFPMMDASGWQVMVHLEPVTPDRWVISDQGEILIGLEDAGRNTDSGKVREAVQSQCAFYGIERDGLNLRKFLRYPFAPEEIQIFAEGLVALSHLLPKQQLDVAVNASHHRR